MATNTTLKEPGHMWASESLVGPVEYFTGPVGQ